MITLSSNDRGVTNVIGSILMVAVIVISTISIGGFILSQNNQVQDNIQASTSLEEAPDDRLRVKWTKEETADKVMLQNNTTKINITEVGDTEEIWYGSPAEDIEVWAYNDEGERNFIGELDARNHKTNIRAYSSTCEAPGNCKATIIQNGSAVTTGNGVTVLTFNPDGTFYSHASFNTESGDSYRPTSNTLGSDRAAVANSPQSCSDCANLFLRNHISSRPAGSYIMLVGDSPGRVPSDPDMGLKNVTEEQYEKMGASFSGDDELERYDSWVMVAKKTDSNRYQTVFERHAPEGGQTGKAGIGAYLLLPR